MVVIGVGVMILVAEGLAALEVHLRVTDKRQYCSWIHDWKLVLVLLRDTPPIPGKKTMVGVTTSHLESLREVD